MNTNMNLTMNMYIYIEDEHKHKREREYEHDDEDGELREDDVGFFSGSAAEAAGLGIRRPRGPGVRGGIGARPLRAPY